MAPAEDKRREKIKRKSESSDSFQWPRGRKSQQLCCCGYNRGFVGNCSVIHR